LFAVVQGGAQELDMPESERTKLEELSADFVQEDVVRMLQILMDLEVRARQSVQPRFLLEMALVHMASMARAVDVGELLVRLQQMEGPAAPGGSGSPAPPALNPKRPDLAPSSQPRDLPEAPPRGPVPKPEAPKNAPAVADSAAGSPSELGLETVKEQWGELVSKVQSTQPTLGIFLKSAQLVSFDGKVLELAFSASDRFPMTQVSDNREAVEQCCAELWGRSIRLRCKEDQGETGETKKGPRPSDSTVKSVLDTFDGELV
jgi:DNA polymerase III gamma/tau subunit